MKTLTTIGKPLRLCGAWTRLGGKKGLTPMGRLHATRRVEGSLEQYALCGFKIPARALTLRPFTIFSSTHPKACIKCAIESINESRY